jgi:hypothetical protein
MAAVSVAVCWLAFAAVWAVTANYNVTRSPAERQRSWYGTGVLPVVLISVAIRRVPQLVPGLRLVTGPRSPAG